MSAFDDLDTELSSAMEAEFGDTAVLSPRMTSEYGEPPVDQARPERDIVGIFSSGPVVAKQDGDARGSAFNSKRVSEVPTFWISAAAYADLGYEAKPGDRLSITGRTKTFRIVAALPTNHGDVELHLTY
ncbi:MAG: hypothetical protein RL299_1919 [Pseudomonadota bacterium]|jgi:hypothetical protein